MRNLSAFVTTLTDDSAIAAAAMTGNRSTLSGSWSTPVAGHCGGSNGAVVSQRRRKRTEIAHRRPLRKGTARCGAHSPSAVIVLAPL